MDSVQPTAPSPSAHRSSRLVSNLRIVSLGTLISRLLGLARDIGMTSLFGAGTVLDAFIVAFRLPNLARQLLGEGAVSTAFLPIFIRSREQHGDQAARETLTAVALVLATILFALVLLCEVIIGLIWWTVDVSESTHLLLLLLMIMLPYMLLICLAALLCSALHAMRQFVWPVLVPIALNVVWLLGLVIASQVTQISETRAAVAAATVTLAGGIQLLIPFVALRRNRMGFIKSWRSSWSRVTDVYRTMIPIVVGMSIVQMSVILDSLIAWGLSRPDDGGTAWCEMLGIEPLLESGTTSALYIGQRLYQFPLGIFGIALGTVLYPLLTQHAQRGQLDLLRRELSRGIRIMIAVAMPASAGLCLLAWPLTNALFRHGEFSTEDANLTFRIIAIYGAGVWSFIGLAILNRAFYAIGDRITPVYYGFACWIVNLILNLIFIFGLKFGGSGMAMGSVIAGTLQVLLALRILNRKLGPLHWEEIRSTLLKGLFATVLMSAACLISLMNLPKPETLMSKLILLGVPCSVGVLVYLVIARLTGMKELKELTARSRS